MSASLVRSQSTASILRTISDEKSLELFTTVALETIDSKNLKSKTKLTRKQYYSRLSRMTRAGLVRRKNGNYVLTTFGRIVYESKVTLEISNELPKEEQQKLIETLLDNEDLKEIIMKGFSAQEHEQQENNYVHSSLLTHRAIG